MGNHLARRGGIWWVRLVVPPSLRELAGRREFIQSTKTHELHIAKLVASALLAEWRQQLLHIEASPMNANVLKLIGPATELATTTYASLKGASESTGVAINQLLSLAAEGKLRLYCRLSQESGYEVPLADLQYTDPELGARGGFDLPEPKYMPTSAVRTVMNGVLAIPKLEYALLANAILANGHEALDITWLESPSNAKKVFVPNEAVVVRVENLAVLTAAVAAVQRHLRSQITDEQVGMAIEREMKATQAAPIPRAKKAHMLFSEAIEAYATSASGLAKTLASAAEQKQRKMGCLYFAEFMGDMPMNQIDSDKLRQYRDGPLRTVPARLNNVPKELRRPTITATVQAIQDSGIEWPTISIDRQAEQMQWLGRFFHWAQPDWIEINPALALKGETGLTKAETDQLKRDHEGDEGRGPFSEDELQIILQQSWFEKGSGAHFKRPRLWYPFEYWLPLLGLYAGCRIGEACQLHLSDVKVVADSVWCLDLNRSSADKSLKNDQSKRIIPIHPVLVELGFLDYCERLRSEGFRRVFPELSYTLTDARYAKEPIRKMSEMLKKLGMPRDSMHVFHCLRHNMNDAMARVALDRIPSIADERLKAFIRYRVMGHQPGEDVNIRHYTSATPMELHALVSCVTYSLPPIQPLDVNFAIEQIRSALNNKDGERRGREDMGPLNDT